jgi:transcription initiation factor TFIIIB Brf1 subunit/transcription initiation factor TFIIB
VIILIYHQVQQILYALIVLRQKDKKVKKYVKQRPYQTRTITDYESGEVICSTCGMVISDKIQSNGPEWRNFEQGGTIIGNSGV